MIEKRHKGNKYIQCFCHEDTEVLVGMKAYAAINLVGFLGSIALGIWIASSSIDIAIKLSAVAIFCLLWAIGFWADYAVTKRIMLKAGHSVSCSHKIAYISMFYSSLWTEFKIMKDKSGNNKTSTIK